MDPALRTRCQDEVKRQVVALIQQGANIQARVRVESGFSRTSLVAVVLSEYQEEIFKEFLAHGARVDHTILHALEKMVAMPLGSSLVKGRENRTQIVIMGQGITRLGAKAHRMVDYLLDSGFSPRTDWDKMARLLARVVPDHTTSSHPRRPLGEIIENRFPRFHAFLETKGAEKTMNQAIPPAPRSAPRSRL